MVRILKQRQRFADPLRTATDRGKGQLVARRNISRPAEYVSRHQAKSNSRGCRRPEKLAVVQLVFRFHASCLLMAGEGLAAENRRGFTLFETGLGPLRAGLARRPAGNTIGISYTKDCIR